MPRTEITSPKLPAPMRRGAFSSGVEAPAGRTIYVSGQVSMDAAGNIVGEEDIELQTATVLEHVKTVVEEAGGDMQDVVKVTVFITDMGALRRDPRGQATLLRRTLPGLLDGRGLRAHRSQAPDRDRSRRGHRVGDLR